MHLRRALLGIFFLFAVVPHLAAQDTRLSQSAEAQLEQWSARIERITEAIGAFSLDARDTARLRGEIETIRDAAAKLDVGLREQIGPAKALLEALGKKPEDGEEPENVAKERSTLNDNLAMVVGQQKRAELTVAKATTLLSQLSARKRQRLADRLLSRSASPLNAIAWQNAQEDVTLAIAGAYAAGKQALAWLVNEVSGVGITIGIVMSVAGVLGVLLRPWLVRATLQPPIDRLPGIQAFIGFIRRCVPVVPVLLAAYLMLPALSIGNQEWSSFLATTLWILIWYALAVALIGSCVAPMRPEERLFPLVDAEAREIYGNLVMVATVIAIFGIGFNAAQIFDSHDDTSSIITVLAAILFAIPASSLLRQRHWAAIVLATKTPVGQIPVQDSAGEQSNPLWAVLRVPLMLGTVLVVAAALTGYESLTRFAIGRTGVGVFLILTLLFARHVIRDAVNWLVNHDGVVDAETANMGRGWLLILIADALLLLSGILGFLLLWGTGWEDISDWTNKALEGFHIGSVRVSPSGVLYAVAIFATVLTLTRFLQNKIEQRVLVHTRLDSGVRNSIKSALGYVGVIGGGLIAISTAGLDLSNLAIIAGALSVGIGFGLQNVVNNFVSGIILLVERPIRVGDWVVVGAHEGYVRRIKVRSTEIETFAHASVIVPNSDLISGTVMNWTHSDARGRIIVPVGVAYGSDTALVRSLLEDCARAHADVLAMPEPVVLFRGFGESSLDFEVRVFLKDIGYCLLVTSDLCFAIDEAFRKNGIEIPFPQRDLHIRDMSRVEALVDKALAARGHE